MPIGFSPKDIMSSPSTEGISLADYQQFAEFLERHSGIVLGENKQYLVYSRLSPLLQVHRYASLTDLVRQSMKPSSVQLRNEVIDAMTTNETLWFRDRYPFELLASTLLPQFSGLNRPLKLWSAACSSGQEPFSLAMTVLETQQRNKLINLRYGASITATDLSPTMLERCRKATYDPLSLGRGLSDERKRTFFDAAEGDKMKIKPEVTRMVQFKQHNLMDNSSALGKFDIVFCRNVLIYFSPENKRKVFKNLANTLNSGGILFLGASESLAGLSDEFEMVRAGLGIYYIKK